MSDESEGHWDYFQIKRLQQQIDDASREIQELRRELTGALSRIDDLEQMQPDSPRYPLKERRYD